MPSSRTQLIDTAVAEMRSDAAAVTEVTLTYLEPLVLSRIAEWWIENGGTID